MAKTKHFLYRCAAVLAVAVMTALAPVQALASDIAAKAQPVWKEVRIQAAIWASAPLALLEAWHVKYMRLYADTAYQTQYRDEFIAAFEARSSLLRETVTTEAVIKGNQAVFLVAGSGGETAKTRGANGLIPARNDDLNQNTVTLEEWHDLVRKTGFNIFASQGNQRAIMQQTSMGVMNRKIDDQIITVLNTGTVTVGATGATPTVPLAMNATVKLQNASVPWDSNITFLIQPSVLAFLEQDPAWSTAEWVDLRPLSGGGPSANWRDRPMAYRWKQMVVVSHPNLPGKATTAEKSFMYHKSALGHAANSGGLMTAVGYNDEQDYTYGRTTCFMGALLLQNAGIVVVTTDGTLYG